MTTADDTFSTSTGGLGPAQASPVIPLADGAEYDLRITEVAKSIDGRPLRMLAFNGSVPGPTLRVRQGTEVTVHVHNDSDHEETVHWHGLRVDNAYDGVPYETQDPIPVGGSFTSVLTFPDDGLYWYHPHAREDYGLEMGLYGCILVDPVDPGLWAPVDREFIVTLDDLLIEEGRIVPFLRSGPTHTAMGRFGNVMLTSGVVGLDLAAQAGEVARLYLTNTANTRIFNVRVPGARLKLIGGDSGRYEHETFVEEILLAPSERAIVDVAFDTPGRFALEHRTPDAVHSLGTVVVEGERIDGAGMAAFGVLRTNTELVAERRRLGPDRARPPDKVLTLIAEMPLLHVPDADEAATTTSPHHHHHDAGDGLEWEDLMPEMNRQSDNTNMVWKIVDAETGAANDDIDWRFRIGDRVKIRLVNTMGGDHPMHHPFHVHGAGRFLVLARDDIEEDNLVWKDTVLIRAGETLDILLVVTNAGTWMAHCHIAEHNQNGMLFSFEVTA